MAQSMSEYYRSADGVVAVYEYSNDYYAAKCFLDSGRVCRSSTTVSSDNRQALMRHIQREWGVASTPIDVHRAMAILTLRGEV